MTEVVQVLQAVCGVLWAVVALVLALGVLRVMQGRGDALDAGRMPVFIVALTQAGFSGRWLIWPHAMGAMGSAELACWSTLYVISAAAALFCLAGHLPANRKLR